MMDSAYISSPLVKRKQDYSPALSDLEPDRDYMGLYFGSRLVVTHLMGLFLYLSAFAIWTRYCMLFQMFFYRLGTNNALNLVLLCIVSLV